jgi:hypothetical protein
MKVVINTCFGGFGLSEKAMVEYAKRKGITLYPERESALCTTYYTVPAAERPAKLDWKNASYEERVAHRTWG